MELSKESTQPLCYAVMAYIVNVHVFSFHMTATGIAYMALEYYYS